MHGLPRILSLFRNEFNAFNYTSARMLYSIGHITLGLLLNLFIRKNVIIVSLCTQRCYGRHLRFQKISKPLPDATSYDSYFVLYSFKH